VTPPLLPRRSGVPLTPGAASALLIEVHPTGVPGQVKVLVLDAGAVPVISEREVLGILTKAAISLALQQQPAGDHDGAHG
jgi:hypothetical protein